MVYEPREDSLMMQENLKKFLKDKDKDTNIIDMGSGSGILIETCKNLGFRDILAADIDPEAIKEIEKKKIHAIRSDLFDDIPKEKRFDLIIFNPPYLPEDKREPLDSRLQTTAGKKGYEIILRFLENAREHLSQKGDILLLFSNLSKQKVILKRAKELGYGYKPLDRRSFFMEELFVYRFFMRDKQD